ncbi:MAG: hypothetical protein AAFQ65_16350, partial [Myxococcota bacterium]
MCDKAQGISRRFGFVTFADPAVIDVVLAKGHVLDGRRVDIKRKAEPAKWRRPKRGATTVASLLACEKKSDVLRLLCCPVAVDSVALMDARLHPDEYFGRKPAANDDERERSIVENRKRRQHLVAKWECCMGCGAEECE